MKIQDVEDFCHAFVGVGCEYSDSVVKIILFIVQSLDRLEVCVQLGSFEVPFH